MTIDKETVALPLVKGVDVQTDARLVQAPSLLEAENTQFSGGGAKKRRGHTSLLVRTEDPVLLNPTSTLWTYGAGYGSPTRANGEEDVSFWTTTDPTLGKLYGVASRDDETVLWDGFRLLSHSPSQASAQAPVFAEVSGSATFPSLNSTPIAKNSEKQGQPEFADNGNVKVVVWIDASSKAKYALFDTTTSALLAQGQLAVTTADYTRAFSLGNWVHILVRDNDDDLLKLFSINALEPNSITYRSYGDCLHFDLWKVSDSEALVAIAGTGASGIDLKWIGTTGSGASGRTSIHYDPTVGGSATLISVSHAVSDEVAIAFFTTTTRIGLAVFSSSALLFESSFTTNVSGTVRLTVSAKRTQTLNATDLWDLYWDNGTDLRAVRFWRTLSAIVLGTQKLRYRLRIASRAFRVGDRTFLWVGHNSTLQSTWFLVDEALLPVGKLNFGVGDVSGLGTNGRVAGVNWLGTDGYSGFDFQTCLGYKLRVTPDNSAQALAGIYTEPSPQAVYLDFAPRLRTAQAGRCTYVAGAQLWAYDGREVVEAGFHTGPEHTLATSAGGSLTADGTYSYRVDLCHRNAQNEEVRSLSLLVQQVLTGGGGGNRTITVTIPTILTRRTDSYFLIYRNAMEDGVPLVNWWLLNSRDPTDASYRANNLGVTSVSFVDSGAVSDTAIQTRELHPATDTYLQPISAPACEIIASGRDRLWVAGGELPPGKVAPSRLFDPGDTPSFNAYLEIQVDRSNEPVTAAGFVGEVAVFFRPNSTYILDSDGPDNIAQGLWNPPRLTLSDVGAQSQDSIARVTNGLMFQSPAGVRLLGPGGALTPIGTEVDSVLKDFDVRGVLVLEKDQEVRFYGSASAGTYVFNYQYGTWTHWSCGGVGVAKNTAGLGLIAREDGYLWTETNDLFTDAGNTYVHRLRTSWLHPGNLGDFQRVRRIGGLGRFASLDSRSHTLRLEVYFDEREFWENRIEWAMPDSTTNQDTFGAATFGAGVLGDTSAVVNQIEDQTWEWTRRPARQKCSVFSVSLEDVDTEGPGFILSAFTFELARKQGLNRTPERTGTGTQR